MKKWLIALLLVSSCAFGQGASYTGQAIGLGAGNALVALPGATVQVCTNSTCSAFAQLYADATLDPTKTITQPIAADGGGNYSIFAAPGNYWCSITAPGFAGIVLPCSVPVTGAVDVFSDQTIGGNKTFTGNVSVSSINNILYVGGTLYPTIGAALAACPSLGCDIYVPSGTYVEPGYTVGNLAGTQAVTIHLGANAVSQVTSRITLESSGSIVGQSRQGSAIRADATFPTNTALVRIGSSASADGSRLEHLQVDCLNIAGCSGVFSAFAQEESGLRDVLVHDITGGGIGIDWETNAANNSFMEDVEVLGASNNNAATIGIKVNDVKGFRGINGVTVNFTGAGTLPTQCIRLDNATTGVFNSIHMEGCTNGIEIGQSTGVQGVVISQIFPSNTITDLIKIDGPDTPKNNLVIMGVLKGSATNAIHDLENGATITDSNVPLYMAGSGQTAYLNGSLQENGNPLRTTIGSGTSTSNGTAIGSGVSQAQPAITISGATTTDVATCSLNAAPVATWQTGIQFLLPVVTANTVTPWLSNPTAGSITPVAAVIRCSVSR